MPLDDIVGRCRTEEVRAASIGFTVGSKFVVSYGLECRGNTGIR